MAISAAAKCLAVARLLWVDADRRTRIDAWLHLSWLIALQVLKGKVGTVLSWTNRRQIEAIGGTWSQLARACGLHVALLVVLSPISILFDKSLRLLRFKWSDFLTRHFLQDFVQLQLNFRNPNPNPNEGSYGQVRTNLDQQIAQDVSKFVDLCLDLSFQTLEALIHLWFLAQLLKSISPRLSALVLIQAAAGTVATATIGRRLPTLHVAARAAESSYRYALTRVRENAEAVALYGGERVEEERLMARHREMQAAVGEQKGCRDVVAWFSQTLRRVAALTPAFILGVGGDGVGLQRGKGDGVSHNHDGHSGHSVHDAVGDHGHSHDQGHGHSHGHGHGQGHDGSLSSRVGGFVQASEAFDHILFHLLLLAENLNDFSKLSSVSESLYSIMSRQKNLGVSASSIELVDLTPIDMSDDSWLIAQNLTLITPVPHGPMRIIQQNLSFSARYRESLLIQGASGVGKTTLLRAIAGLWPHGSGRIKRPHPDNMFFIPQSPYMCIGSLRQQVLYPLDESQVSASEVDNTIVGILEKVNLGHLLQRKGEQNGKQQLKRQIALDRVEQWSEILSTGEQQRVAFARLLFAKPGFAVLDEATSACDEANETNLYRLMSHTCEAWISIGHRESIRRFHTSVIELKSPESI